MATLTIASDISLNGFSKYSLHLTLKSAEALVKGDVVSIDSNGKFKKSTLTDTALGMVVLDTASGQPATAIGKGAHITDYSTSMTAGTVLFLDNENAGKLVDVEPTGESAVVIPVAIAVNETDIVLL